FQDVPCFIQGGLQLEAWDGNTNLAVKTSTNTQTMGSENELVQWTQYLQRDSDGHRLRFGISAAASQTWGNFTGAEFTVYGADAFLNNYSPDYSVQNSGITFGFNLVQSMAMSQNRRYYSDGSVVTDFTPRIVFSSG